MFQMFLHGRNLAKIYEKVDPALLPDEYLPDDHTGPCAGSIHQIVGKASCSNLYLIETPFHAFVNRADPDQAAPVRAALSGSALFANGNMLFLILHKWTWLVIYLFYAPTWMFIYTFIFIVGWA